MNPITTAVRELNRGKYCIYPTSYKKDAEFYKKTSKILNIILFILYFPSTHPSSFYSE